MTVVVACSNCGSEVPATSRFCPICGSRLREVTPEVGYSDIPPGTVVVCAKCQAHNFRTDAVCRKCEADLTEVRKALAGKTSPQGTSGNRLCQNCGRSGPPEYRFCDSCGRPLSGMEGIWKVPGLADIDRTGIDPLARAIFYLFSFLAPPLGVIIGALFYIRHRDPAGEFRAAANTCLLLALISLIIWGVVGAILWIGGTLYISGL